ncbi:MAG TPA: RcpC/CpaB family pilus assembly protein [Gemmataceae bacterium]|nr:RcpC/CpaB family pilus assembly protein [Gemmataceae bacterium]
MVTRTCSRGARAAAVSASTVFAIALAIVAGLIFAWLFKIVLLDKPKTAKPVDDSIEITLAAGNIYNDTEIRPIHVKKVKVSREKYAAYAKKGTTLLTGNQPVGRVAKVSIMAEEPFFAENLYPFAYPDSVDKKLRKGMRSVIVTVPAKEAMVQTNDYVDVYFTLASEVFGPGSNGTAQIAKAAKVVARFGTTRPGAQPVSRDAPREYTLEVTPYRYAMIELAKSMGARFSLGVVPQKDAVVAAGDDSENTAAPVGNDLNDPREQSAEHVSGADLAALFGIGPVAPGVPPWDVEKYVGIKNSGKTTYPGYIPPSRAGGSGTPATPATSGAESRARPPQPAVPVAYTPTPSSRIPPPVRMPPPSGPGSFSPSGAVASSARNFGFRAPADPSTKGCST